MGISCRRRRRLQETGNARQTTAHTEHIINVFYIDFADLQPNQASKQAGRHNFLVFPPHMAFFFGFLDCPLWLGLATRHAAQDYKDIKLTLMN